MARTPDLTPPIDAGIEQEFVLFDFGLILADGEALTNTITISCTVVAGTDPSPAARLLGSLAVVESQVVKGRAASAVRQLFGNTLDGVTYRLQCQALSTGGQTLSLWSHIKSMAAV